MRIALADFVYISQQDCGAKSLPQKPVSHLSCDITKTGHPPEKSVWLTAAQYDDAGVTKFSGNLAHVDDACQRFFDIYIRIC